MTIEKNEQYRVLLERGEFEDESRNGRIVPCKIYYPVDHDLDKMPLVLWSHGFGGSMDGASFVSRFVASRGFVIVHLTHKGTDSSLWEGKGAHPWDILREIEIVPEMIFERVKDISFLLDKLEERNTLRPEISRYIDMERVGISGHSMGAITAQAMAGMKLPDAKGGLVNVRDERISCAVAYSPGPLNGFTDAPPEEIYGPICVPMFHMTGSDDNSPTKFVMDYKKRLIVRDNAGHPEQYVQILEGGDHMIYNGTRGKLTPNSRRAEHEALIIEAVEAFWRAYLSGDEIAKLWLQEKYGNPL